MNNINDEIIKFIGKKQLRPTEIVGSLSYSQSKIYKGLNELVTAGYIEKLGMKPKTYYKLVNNFNKEIIENFIYIDPAGNIIKKIPAFEEWCRSRGFDFLEYSKKYTEIIKKYDKKKKDGLINSTDRIKNIFKKNIFVDEVWYIDFFSIEIFGKTKLGQYVLHGKSTSNKALMDEVISISYQKIHKLVRDKKIDAVCYVPPTVKRKIQFMKKLEKGFNINLPHVSINKFIKDGSIAIQQKTLKKLEDKIINASATFAVNEKEEYDRVLIIDDAIGSGATINQIAKKLKEQGIAKKVYGVGIVGSIKGIEVISVL